MNASAPERGAGAAEGYGFVCAVFAASRLMLIAAALAAPFLLPPMASSPGLPTELHWDQYLVRWDANWYREIAVSGYEFEPGKQSSVAFFPLFPMAMRVVSWTGIHAGLAGILVANASFLVGLLLLHRWMRREFADRQVADGAVLLLAFCPQAVWTGLGFSESTFLLTLIGTLSEARRGRLWAAVLWGVALGLSRPNAIIVALPLALILGPAVLAAVEGERRGEAAWGAAAALSPWIGHALYLGYLQLAFGNWQAAQVTNREGWGVALNLKLESVWGRLSALELFNPSTLGPNWVAFSWWAGLAVTAWALLILWEKRLGLWMAAYCLGFWALLFLTEQNGGPMQSMARFGAGLLPVPIALAVFSQGRRWALPVLCACQGGLALLVACIYFAGYSIP